MLTITPTENERIRLAIVNPDDSITEIGNLVLYRKKGRNRDEDQLRMALDFPSQIAIWRDSTKMRKDHAGNTVPLNMADDIKNKAARIAIIDEIPRSSD